MRTIRTRSAVAVLLLAGSTALAADWPQWRGPDRTNVSKETGLLNAWPKAGPTLAWKAAGLGDGVAPVSVVGDRVFLTGNVGGEVVCAALSATDGKRVWGTPLGTAAKESSVMRWLAQTAPTVEGGRVFAVTAYGNYTCLAADTGNVLWQKHYQKDFAGKTGWGFCDYPLVDGDRLIICPGGDKNTVAALDKKTGELIWACSIPGEAAAHSVLIPADIRGVKQYVVHLSKGLYGVSAEGKLLWKHTGLANGTANTHAPVVRGNEVFYANGYGVGHVLLKVGKKGEEWLAEEIYKQRANYHSLLGSPTPLGDRILINVNAGMRCVDWSTAKFVWETPGLRRCTYTVADRKLFIRAQTGQMILADADAKQYRQVAEFTPPQTDPTLPAWTFPVVAQGRLFIRDYDTLLCYDVRDPGRRQRASPDAVFVPTPSDVVKRMLELAAVSKKDVVYDLGSGDGRIVIAAAKTYGCKAVGVELDEELVALSRERAKEAGVEKLVTFRHANLFEADFSEATVVALYILPAMSQKLIPKFDKLKPGTRIVSHAFAIPGAKPEKVLRITSEDDDVERPVYLYRVPLTRNP